MKEIIEVLATQDAELLPSREALGLSTPSHIDNVFAANGALALGGATASATQVVIVG
ncbi:hypothetical protein ORV05_03725 [Amycolatopsis cynarae]|uniref:Uncharacterized protein n=1 Tax=Amycolatopsis cynarae TaxID=2995223 RepID=A0ABY7B4Q5_9PSEU|nr:hypothetical protein [Amycolatopsis sp. HUAS 11-8]WAL66920.1 hypothetical protein ORV05_03725 [Amycolatopsis sp. HUAS 11-8]